MRTPRLLIFAALLLAWAGAGPARAYAPLGYPGAVWGNLTRDGGNVEGTGSQGWIEQGVDWLRLPGGAVFNTYADLQWQLRTKNNTYYNSDGPDIGFRLKKSFLSAGFDYSPQTYPGLRQTQDLWRAYLTWYYGWSTDRFPGAVWGNLTDSFDDIAGKGTMGWINQGILLARLPGQASLKAYAEYRWRLRTLNNKYFNANGPAVGAELDRKPFALGVDHYWERLPQLPQSVNTLELYLNWYYAWDLRR